ncbi:MULTISPECIES: class I SAM-dependent methyltransferase [unclassified Lysobacter]|uniref:class I SAM-dependent methyltransferase n=1 Tax=unclassified Lysobacter TaxID=2635362 RepID=UPI001C24F2C3|nr:class I SAM-dependent methyltransferase [Lysobacter sp. MMG2]MBU8977484.1 class I SAM-dependent methyltransferase [Lysobacter sp. MMG2]
MPAQRAEDIARAFMPRWNVRYDYYYARTKLGTDPLYPGVCDVLRGTRAPLLDIGCGLGLLAHALRADGQTMPYRGYDNDASKVERARRASQRRELADVEFGTADLGAELPTHRGSVALLDVMQFVPADAQMRAIDTFIGMLEPGAKLVIRTGLADGSHRAQVTRAVDIFAKVVGWMNAAPIHYPDAEMLRARFLAAGLHSEFIPLRGNTPFNNWRIVATRAG